MRAVFTSMLIMISCSTTNNSLILPDDELSDILEAKNIAKAVFDKFCENGEQVREFVVEINWPLGYCGGGKYQDESDKQHNMFLKSMDNEAVDAINNSIIYAENTLTNDKRKVFDVLEDNPEVSSINWQCGIKQPFIVVQEAELYFYDYGRPREKDGFKHFQYVEQIMFENYIVPLKFNNEYQPQDESLKQKNYSDLEVSNWKYQKAKYFKSKLKYTKTFKTNIVTYRFTYDLKDFCNRGKLKQDLIVY